MTKTIEKTITQISDVTLEVPRSALNASLCTFNVSRIKE